MLSPIRTGLCSPYRHMVPIVSITDLTRNSSMLLTSRIGAGSNSYSFRSFFAKGGHLGQSLKRGYLLLCLYGILGDLLDLVEGRLVLCLGLGLGLYAYDKCYDLEERLGSAGLWCCYPRCLLKGRGYCVGWSSYC